MEIVKNIPLEVNNISQKLINYWGFNFFAVIILFLLLYSITTVTCSCSFEFINFTAFVKM